jgi:multiple sugar transport system ATP-binding protein
MGRAIIREPAAFLMDEPLSNLDAKLRVSMRAELSRLHSRLRVTTVYVTHDQVEAMTLGQRVAVMREGKIQQIDSPSALYARPANLFVAAFIGSPAMNLVAATANGDRLAFGGFEVETARVPAHEGALAVGIRPEAFEDAEFARRRTAANRGRGERRRGSRSGRSRDLPARRASLRNRRRKRRNRG